METFFTLFLMSLFVPILLGLAGTNMLASSVSAPDKLLKVVMSYFLMLMIFEQKKKFRVNVLIYVGPSLIYLAINAYHYFTSSSGASADSADAKKSLVRLAVFIFMLLISSTLRMKMKNFRFLLYGLTLFAFPLGIMSVRSMLTGTSTRRDMLIGEFVRAGGDLVPTNALAAILNITTLCALAAFFIVKKRYQKIGCILAVLISQIGCFSTFSNGSLVSIIVSLFIIMYFFRKIYYPMYKKMRMASVCILVALAALTIAPGISETMFSRLSQTDSTGTLTSVASRTGQYRGFLNIVTQDTDKLLFGVGITGVPAALGTRVTLHNSFLLPLLEAGIFGFIAFLFLSWLSFRNLYAAVMCSIQKKEDTILTIFILAAYVGYSVQILTVPYSMSVTTWFFFILSYCFSNYVKENHAVLSSCPHTGSVLLPT